MKKTGLLLLICSFVLFGCNDHYTILESTVQKWIGGAPGSGSGKNYLIKVQKPSNTAIILNKAWLGDREKGKNMKLVGYENPGQSTFPRGEVPAGVSTFYVAFTEYFASHNPNPRPGGPMKEDNPASEAAPDHLPEAFKTGAIVWFTVGGEEKYVIIDDFKVLETLPLP